MPGLVYAKGFGDSSSQEMKALVVDGNGNVYFAGIWTGTTPPDGFADWINGCTGLTTQHAFVAKLSPIGAPLWAECLDAMSGSALALALGAATERVVVGGSFEGTLAGYPGGSVTSKGGTDGFVARLTKDGVRDSLTTVGGPLDDAVTGVVGAGTDVFMAGTFQGTASFGAFQRTAASGSDLFLARWDGAAFTFANAFGNSGGAPTVRLSGDTGSVHLAGSFEGSLAFGAPTAPLVSSGARDGFVARFDASGNPTYATSMGGAGNDVVHSIAASATSSAYVLGGEFASSLDFDGAAGQPPLVATDAPDAFLVALQMNHALIRQRDFGASGAQQTFGVGARGNVVLAGGAFTGTVSFGGVPFTSADEDGFAIKGTTAGELDWVVQVGNDTGDQRIVAADRATGVNAFGGTMYAGFSMFGTSVTQTGVQPDVFVVAFED